MKKTQKSRHGTRKRIISVLLAIALCVTQFTGTPVFTSAAQSNAEITKTGNDVILPTETTSQTAYTSVTITDEDNTRTIIDCLNPTGAEEKLIPGTTYYLRVKLNRPGDMKYFYLFAGEPVNGKAYYNGINIINPPGAKFDVGSCESDVFTKVDDRINLANPVYGSNNTEFSLMDGLWKYEFKGLDKIAADQPITIDIGFVIEDDAYNNLETLTDALQIYMTDADNNITNLVKTDLSVTTKGQVTVQVQSFSE